MFYTFDIGNTNSTLYFFKNFEDRGHKINPTDYQCVQDSPVFVSSVNRDFHIPFNNTKSVSDYRKNNQLFNMQINYSQSLGEDRLISAFYFYKQYHKPIIFIDAGSFTTVDYIDQNGFGGGIILPGLQKVKNIYGQGNLLHSPESVKIYHLEKMAKSTDEAIQVGASLTVAEPIKALLNKDKKTFISGGSAKELLPLLEGFQIELIENAVHLGLKEVAKEIL